MDRVQDTNPTKYQKLFQDQFQKEFGLESSEDPTSFHFRNEYAQLDDLLEIMELMNPVLRAWNLEPERHPQSAHRMIGEGWDSEDPLFADVVLHELGNGWGGVNAQASYDF
jgi:hypothetical protein